MDSSSHNGEVIPSSSSSSSNCDFLEGDESASIKLGLSQLPSGVTVELYQCPVCRLNAGGKEALFAVEAKLISHLNAHANAGDILRHHDANNADDDANDNVDHRQLPRPLCERPCLDETGARILCDRWFMVQLFSNETGYGKLKWRARQPMASGGGTGVADQSASPSKSTFSVTIPAATTTSAGVASAADVSPKPTLSTSLPSSLQQQQQQHQTPPQPANDDANDQDKNISLDWPHQETADHADSLWNDELSQLEKKVVEEILGGGDGGGGHASAAGAFSLLGNGFSGNDDVFGATDTASIVGPLSSVSNERRLSGNQPNLHTNNNSSSSRRASVSDTNAASTTTTSSSSSSRSDLIGTLNFPSTSRGGNSGGHYGR